MFTKYLQNSLRLRLTGADDGWSGGTFDRPDWKRLIADIEAGKVGVLLTKDECDKIELKSESPQKCGFCDVREPLIKEHESQVNSQN